MPGKRHTTEQKVRILREAEQAGKTIVDVCREHQISEQTFHRWKSEFGMLEVDLLDGVIRGHSIKGVTNQHELHRLLNHYGLLDTTGVPDRYRDGETGRRDRIAVLNRAMADLLIECVDPDDQSTTGPQSSDDDGPEPREAKTIDPKTVEGIEA